MKPPTCISQSQYKERESLHNNKIELSVHDDTTSYQFQNQILSRLYLQIIVVSYTDYLIVHYCRFMLILFLVSLYEY